MSTYPPRARDVDQTINAIVAESAAIAVETTRRLRLVGSINNDRPAGLAVAPEPTVPVTLALGDFAHLLALAGQTPMAHQLEATPACALISVPQVQAMCLLLEGQGSEWARNVQEAVAVQVHPSFLPPSADDANPHGSPRPVLA